MRARAAQRTAKASVAAAAALVAVKLVTGLLTASLALIAEAVHFASDLLGSVAVLVGLLVVSGGNRDGDSIAALAVAVLVLFAAARVLRRNAGVLMDASPGEAEAAARSAIESIQPPVRLR